MAFAAAPQPADALGRPGVVFGDGRAETSTHVRLESFDGPLALLLALIGTIWQVTLLRLHYKQRSAVC